MNPQPQTLEDLEIEIDEEKKKTVRSRKTLLVQMLIRYLPILAKKSAFCKHSHGCILNVLEGSLRSFLIAFGVRSLFELLTFLMNRKKQKSVNFFKVLFQGDAIRFSLFPCFYVGLQKCLLCSQRNLSKDDKKIFTFISGFVAGFVSIMMLNEDKRANWALYLITRSFDTAFQSIQNQGIIKKRTYYYVLLFLFETMVTSYAFGNESELLADYMHKFYQKFGSETQIEQQMRSIWHEQVRRRLFPQGN